MDVFDPQSDAWRQVSSMPAALSYHGGVALDGKIYLMGGLGGAELYLSTAHVYDPQADSWQPLANMATGRSSLATAVAGGKIYVIGGETAGGDGGDYIVATTEAFDPLLGAWAEVASMSVARSHHAAAVIDGKIYVIGGQGADGNDLDSACRSV